MASTVIPIRASTQEHIDILDILDDIVVSKDGSCSIVLQVTAINFDLLSDMEQDAIIFAYAGLLNSLTFPIQIVIRSAIKDVTNYINLIKQQEEKQKKQLLLDQLKQYRTFVETLVKDNRVLDKRFYVVVPFTSLELGLTPALTASFSKTKRLPYPKSYILERAKMNLYPKRDHLMRQFSRLGLQCRQLNTQQLIEMFYGIYNEESVGQRLGSTHEYSAPIVSTRSTPPQPLAQPTTTPTTPQPPMPEATRQSPPPSTLQIPTPSVAQMAAHPPAVGAITAPTQDQSVQMPAAAPKAFAPADANSQSRVVYPPVTNTKPGGTMPYAS